MTTTEAKETKRWWLQNSYKFKGQETPAEVMEAMRILDGIPIPVPAEIKVVPPDPEKIIAHQTTAFAGRDGFSHQSIELDETTPIQSEIPAEVMPEKSIEIQQPPIKRYGKPLVQDEFTQTLAQLNAERAGASEERIKQINAECSSIYLKRSAKKKLGISEVNSTKIPQKMSKPMPEAIEKPAPLPVKAEKPAPEIPQHSVETPSPIVQTLNAIPARLLEIQGWLSQLTYREWEFMVGYKEDGCCLQVAFSTPEGL